MKGRGGLGPSVCSGLQRQVCNSPRRPSGCTECGVTAASSAQASPWLAGPKGVSIGLWLANGDGPCSSRSIFGIRSWHSSTVLQRSATRMRRPGPVHQEFILRDFCCLETDGCHEMVLLNWKFSISRWLPGSDTTDADSGPGESALFVLTDTRWTHNAQRFFDKLSSTAQTRGGLHRPQLAPGLRDVGGRNLTATEYWCCLLCEASVESA